MAERVFPYFGGKARVAAEVWARLGPVKGFLDPFGGSLAVPLANPHAGSLKIETLNDLDGFVCNFWRAIANAPDETASWADWPVSHIDLAARHLWLKENKAGLVERLRADPDAFDAKVAGWWWWGICQWVGRGWGEAKRLGQRPHLGDAGMGVHSLGQRPHLGDAGMGVHSLGQRPHLSNAGMGGFYKQAHRLAKRLRFTRVTCCDWKSLRSGVNTNVSLWGVFLDPPYTKESGRDASLYGAAGEDSGHLSLGHEVAAWALEVAAKGHRVALCGIDGEYEIPEDWDRFFWKTGGYAYGGRDRKEVIWFSPSCIQRGGTLV